MTKFRYRIRYRKFSPFHLLSHLDMYRMWERVFRRVRIPVLYSQGFNPRPLFSFPFATPLGVESKAEYFEVLCGEPMLPYELYEKLSSEVPNELGVEEVCALAPFDPPLQKILRGIVYTFFFRTSLPKRSLILPEGVTLLESVEETSSVISFLFEGERLLWNPLKFASLLTTEYCYPFPERILKERILV
ncbi:TIGR03936 family radical SAM-associated protein [Candidatus Caldatribacterium sp.]|uniref:TIGR03936 family radical SAM-associated protein n=1 Tax=Candidatus Caldatribacterium sp. TaxID=2282143 RepID=UPI0029928E3C|nr:TIGR03936 family radical SAM-associated protein [Candidatus Caldatribacterium sp.]MDW8080695.1 TIGR03936 family radical SAM-associated protein [Candidatus Calescibacterium sp.]